MRFAIVMVNLSENFLFFLWQYRLFATSFFKTTAGEPVRIINPGLLNKHAGPDFSEAKIVINGTTWVGNVEIHIKSSDWILHNHHNNLAYESVILHVVYENDQQVYTNSGLTLPTLELKGLFPEELHVKYLSMLNSSLGFPCKAQIKQADDIAIKGFLSRMMVDRLEQKSLEVFMVLDRYKGDWNETFYFFLARNFGFKVNALPFEITAASLPYHILIKHNTPLQVDALIFGQAGFLDHPLTGEYPQGLQKEYRFLKHKYSLTPVDVSVWKFLRMRPRNFPTIRLAQFAALQRVAMHLFSKIIEIKELPNIYKLFQDFQLNEYWSHHYHFGKATSESNMKLGVKSVENLVINTVCLFLFAYGRYSDQEHLTDRALDFLEMIPAEGNSVVSQYIVSGITVDTAFASQSILQLNKYFCTQKKCLNCGIGINLLKK